jgi:ribonuclease-3
VLVVSLTELQRVLGISFKDAALLERALIHSSYVNENPGYVSNERLEFFGDAVLGMVIAEILYREPASVDEGTMTRYRAQLVSRASLADIARQIKLGDYLYLGAGEVTSKGRTKTANLAGALEAVIAAVYFDRGLDIAYDLIARLFGAQIGKTISREEKNDDKTRLQEVLQSKYKRLPLYRLLEETGPSHDKVFTVEVRNGDRVLAVGSGKSKKAAEISAARRALKKFPL